MKNILLLGIIFLSLIFARRDCLQHTPRDVLGRTMRPDKDTLVISPSGHFYIHFDTTGSGAPDLTDSDGNGIPDYVDEVGIIADSARHVLVDIMEWEEEPFDGEGGYDIYLTYFSSPYVYGFNYIDPYCTISEITEKNECIEVEGIWVPGASYLKIANDYTAQSNNSNFGLSPLEIMRITLGHEYFHGIQWGYEENLGINAYFYEMTSMWFEDILIPDGNDYLDGWADDLLDNPAADFDNTGDGYELALFGHYLSSFIDVKGIDDGTKSTILREIWERFRDFNSSAYISVKYILENNYNWDFSEAWVDFISRNVYNSLFEDMNNPYFYYIDQSIVKPINTNPILINSQFPFEMSLSWKAAAIQSLKIDETAFLEITPDNDAFYIRLAKVSGAADHKFYDSLHTYLGLYKDDKLHLFLGKKDNSTFIQFNINYLPTDSLPPLPPSNLSVSESYHTMELNWQASPGPGDSLYYKIYREYDEVTTKIDSTSSTGYLDQYPFQPNSEYRYYVTCNNQFGESVHSETITVNYPIHKPGIPTFLHVFAYQDSMQVIWKQSTGPGDSLYYQIFRNSLPISTSIDTSYMDLNIISETRYHYAISTINDEGESQLIEAVSVVSWPEISTVLISEILTVFPNPVNQGQNLTLIYSLAKNEIFPSIDLVNIRGQVVNNKKLQSNNQGWHQESIQGVLSQNPASGIYFIRMNTIVNDAVVIKITILN